MLRSPEHVALHEVAVAAELVQIHSGGSDHPDVSVGETAAQSESDLLQTPAEPLSSFRLHRHLLLEVLTQQTSRRRRFKAGQLSHTEQHQHDQWIKKKDISNAVIHMKFRPHVCTNSIKLLTLRNYRILAAMFYRILASKSKRFVSSLLCNKNMFERIIVTLIGTGP